MEREEEKGRTVDRVLGRVDIHHIVVVHVVVPGDNVILVVVGIVGGGGVIIIIIIVLVLVRGRLGGRWRALVITSHNLGG